MKWLMAARARHRDCSFPRVLADSAARKVTGSFDYLGNVRGPIPSFKLVLQSLRS
jgi:hypothetical protein